MVQAGQMLALLQQGRFPRPALLLLLLWGTAAFVPPISGPSVSNLGLEATKSPLDDLFSIFQSKQVKQEKPLASPSTNYVSLGALKVSPIGIGTWAWGNKLLWGYDTKDDAEIQKAFDYILSQGVNWFDTADSYGTGALEGRAEVLLGEFIRAHQYKAPGVAREEEVRVATKLAPYPWRIGKDSYVRAAEGSLKRLERDVLDVAQLHWAPPLGWQEQEYWAALAQLYTSGKARAVGLSNYGPKQLAKAHAGLKALGAPLASNQVQFSLVSTLPVESGLVETAAELGVRLIAYSPLGLGLLTGRYNETYLPSGPRGLIFKELLPELRPVLSVMDEISKQAPGRTYSQVAINWCRAKGAIPIVGVKNLQQAKDNLACLAWTLKPAEVEALDRASKGMKKKTVQNIFQTP